MYELREIVFYDGGFYRLSLLFDGGVLVYMSLSRMGCKGSMTIVEYNAVREFDRWLGERVVVYSRGGVELELRRRESVDELFDNLQRTVMFATPVSEVCEQFEKDAELDEILDGEDSDCCSTAV